MKQGGVLNPDDALGQKVLDFYRTLPFNYYSTPHAQAEAIRRANSITAQYGLADYLDAGISVIDIGCGAGWLANSMSLHYAADVTGIDFNAVAIERAQEVASLLQLSTRFQVQDLFEFLPEERYALVTSIGVLHHTQDCLAAVRRICREVLAPGGHLYLGLYHKFGRKPFLEYFESLKERKKSEEDLLTSYAELHSQLKDQSHLLSWFRDQVLHPHETQHTLSELLPVFESEGYRLISTSVNRFAPFQDADELLRLEESLEELGRTALEQKRYYPGFFICIVQRG